MKTSFTLSLACMPLTISKMRVKLQFHFGFTIVPLPLGGLVVGI